MDFASGFFNAGDMNDPRVNAALRQKIAMSMLASKKGYPKNIGEGLTSIGDALGDIGTMRKLAQFDLGQQDKVNADYTATPPEAPSGSPTTQPQRHATTYGQDEGYEPAPTQSAAIVPSRGTSPLTTAPSQPASMLRGNLPADLTAPTATLRDLAPPVPAQTVAGLGGGPGPATPPPSGQAVPTLGPQSAAQGVGGPAVSPRDAIAAAMVQKPPVMAADDAAPPQTSFNAPNFLPMPQQGPAAPSPGNQISAAPPIGAPIKAQGAPAQPVPNPGYVTPNPGPVPQVAQEPMGPREFQLKQLIANNPGNPYYATKLGPELKQLEDARALRQTQQMKQFESNQILQRSLVEQGAKDRGTQVERINKDAESQLTQRKAVYEIGKMKDEADVRRQFQNMDPSVAYKMLEDTKKSADAGRGSLIAVNRIRDAIEGGAIFGSGADWKLSAAKAVTAMGFADKGDVIANTEVIKSQVAPIVSQILKATVGTNQISENDRRFAENAAGGNINLDEKSVRRIMDFIGQNSRFAVDTHNKIVNTVFPQEGSVGRTMFGVDVSDLPKSPSSMLPKDMKIKDDMATKWANDNPGDPRAAIIWKQQGYLEPPDAWQRKQDEKKKQGAR